MVYIVYHKKYRNAIKKVAENIFNCRGLSGIESDESHRGSTYVSRQAFNADDSIEKFRRARLSVHPDLHPEEPGDNA